SSAQLPASGTEEQVALLVQSPWLILSSPDTVLRDALFELLANPRFSARADSAFAPAHRKPFPVYVGGLDLVQHVNARRHEKVRIPSWAGGVSLYSHEPDGSVSSGAIIIDVGRLHRAVGHDSVSARQLVRDALLHEFGHMTAVAE